MGYKRNSITAAIKNKFGWTVKVYSERRCFSHYSVKLVIRGGSKCTSKNTNSYRIKQQLKKDGVWSEVTSG